MKEELEVSMGITKNLGDFNSARIDATHRISFDREVTDEDWDKAWREVEEQVEKKLVQIIEEMS